MSLEPTRYRVGTLSYTKPALAVLFFWLLWGDVCYMLMENVVPSVMPLKFQSLGASNAAIGLILSTIPNGITAVLNPVLSFKSDRYRSRWGRRIPFIVLTLPPLTACLIGLGFSDTIGAWTRSHLGSSTAGYLSPDTLALIVIGGVMVLFSFFNTFVTSAFWYLFNDVVPEHLLARFMAWFRVVSMASVSLYDLFVFKYAGTHSTAIMVGAALLYLVGFGLMCLNVREGEYPPPPPYAEGGSGVVAAVRTYARECHSLSHYWYVFLIGMCMGGAFSATTFMLFFYQSTGLDLAMIGTVMGVGSIATAVMTVGTGWLADRYHPVRVVMAGLVLQVVLATPATLLWLFWQPTPQTSYYAWLAITVLLVAPAAALITTLDPPLFMRIFPRDRYGQFCSANALWRSASMIVGGVLVGLFLDVLKRHFGPDVAYRCLPLWQLACYACMLVCVVLLYRSWNRYGGDENYRPPLPDSAAGAGAAMPPDLTDGTVPAAVVPSQPLSDVSPAIMR